MIEKKNKAKVIIVGGSIDGVSCAHELILAGWEVVVLEKTSAAPTGSPTVAGLGIDPLAQQLIVSSVLISLLPICFFILLYRTKQQIVLQKLSWTLTRDDQEFSFRVAHCTDLHGLLYNALPRDILLGYSGYYAWRVLDFSGHEDSETITGIRKHSPTLGQCLYFDLSFGTHAGLYELPSKRLN
ncbi:hypothetical protein CRYUN_Cryun03dG0083200 [Craigia yunnanensis]